MSDDVKIAIISLISAGITALFAFLGNLVLAKKKNHEDDLKEARRQQYQDDRDDYFDAKIKEIDKKLEEHNHYAKKFESVDIKMTGFSENYDKSLKKMDILNEKVSNFDKKMTGMQKDIEYLRKDFANVTCKPRSSKKD